MNRLILAATCGVWAVASYGAIGIRCDYPGGNVKVLGIDEATGTVRVAPDLRDTSGYWFHFDFTVTGAAGRTLHFRFPADGREYLATLGPAISRDAGVTWCWLNADGRRHEPANAFDYAFAADEHATRFAVSIPYSQKDWDAFVAPYRARTDVRFDTLCKSRGGTRDVELLRVPCRGRAEWLFVLTARHHASETTGNPPMEGALAVALGDSPEAGWLRQHADCCFVPFMDKDGVEEGDQGKNRRPYDHNRDYAKGRYPTVRALKDLIVRESAGKRIVFLDLHAPHVRTVPKGGGEHDQVFTFGADDPALNARWNAFRAHWQAAQRGGRLVYDGRYDIQARQGYWNVMKKAWDEGRLSSDPWVRTLPNAYLATCCEFGYSLCGGVNSVPAMRELGGNMFKAAVRTARDAESPTFAGVRPTVRKVLNVVNFVRALDPRQPKAEYVRAFDEEVKLNRKHGFPNTVLLQYDALVDAEMMAVARTSDPAKTEFGLWFEMSRPLNEAAGLPWKPTAKHRDWNWDWFINPGFLMAYDHDGRRKLIDAAFAKFKETFGRYPKSVGSWLLDAYSMDYMVGTYGVDGFCICREQDNTDAYGLRGGYSNGAYYPSKRNMLSAAVDMKNAVRAPVFKMLTPDPIHNYGCPDRLYADYPYKRGCPTMEPAWDTGFEPRIVDWFFRVYTEPQGLLNLSYMQAGQENSFGWKMISRGWPMQCAKIAAERAAGRIAVETMGETARRFKQDHPANCPQTQIALEDWNGNRRKSIWYNSRFYRANLILEGGQLVFRDIHKMADDFEEPFLDRVCTGWQALYFTPPVVDQWLFRDKGVSGTMALSGEYAALAAEAVAQDALLVTATRTDGTKATVRFEESRIVLTGCDLSAAYKPDFRKTLRVGAREVGFLFAGHRYKMPVVGRLVATDKGFDIGGGTIALDLAAPGS